MKNKNCVSTLSALVFWLCGLLIMGCDYNPFNHDADSAAEENFSFDLAIVNQSRLRLEGVAGTIFITGAPESDAVKITGQKRVESSSFEDAEEHLKELEVNVQKLTNEISIKSCAGECGADSQLTAWEMRRWTRNGFVDHGEWKHKR